MEIYDIAIIGGGPAGLTCAIYSARGGMKTVLVEKMGIGGQVALTDKIDNYPGVPNIEGIELGMKMAKQVEGFGVDIVYDEVSEIDIDNKIIKTLYTDEIRAKAIVLCMGSSAKKLGVSGEEKLIGRGVGYCAVCDGAFFKGKTVAVVGGGNAAVEDAMYLTRFAKKVYIIHRRDQFRASKILSDAILHSEVEILWNTVIRSINGDDRVKGITIENIATKEIKELPIDGVFISVGQQPKTELVKDKISLDINGYIITDENMHTSAKGVFAAGDLRVKSFRQIVTATADGAIASLSAGHYLMNND